MRKCSSRGSSFLAVRWSDNGKNPKREFMACKRWKAADFARRLPSIRLQQRVLRAFAPGQKRQRLACDVGLEVRALLMRLERGLVAEQLVEQELRRIVLGARDQEQHCACLALRFGQEAVEDGGHLVG